MTHVKDVLGRARPLVAAAAFTFAAAISAIPLQSASALALLDRSLMVTSTAPSDDADGRVDTPGHPTNGAEVGHFYTFTTQSGANDIYGITIQFCDSPFGYAIGETCTIPNGFDASAWDGATVVVQENGAGSEAWTINATGTNILTLVNAATAYTFGSADVITIDFSPTATEYFVNPTTAYFSSGSPQRATYFAHIATHNTNNPDETNATTLDSTTVDDGTVTNNITESISITTRVQETLNFSVEGEGGAGDAVTGPTPAVGTTQCDPLVETGAIRMGDTNNALSPSTDYFAKSYFRLATNSSNGASVYYSGDTLYSGANFIDAIGATAVASTTGIEQFGFAFDAGDVDANVYTGSGTSQLVASAQYGTNVTGYAFETASVATPVEIAASPGVVSCDTGAIEYVANIAEETEAGIYTTKINFIASPSY